MAWEAAAQHYLTDAFAAGHLRTPVAAMREFWQVRYPRFWDGLRAKVASDTATALRELTPPLRLVPPGVLSRRALAAVEARTAGYPRIALGDLLAKVFHDWDNTHGLDLEGSGRLFGDGFLDQGATRQLALAAVRAGVDDVEVAFALGGSGRAPGGEALYQAVRERTGAAGDAFRAETAVPRAPPTTRPRTGAPATSTSSGRRRSWARPGPRSAGRWRRRWSPATSSRGGSSPWATASPTRCAFPRSPDYGGGWADRPAPRTNVASWPGWSPTPDRRCGPAPVRSISRPRPRPRRRSDPVSAPARGERPPAQAARSVVGRSTRPPRWPTARPAG